MVHVWGLGVTIWYYCSKVEAGTAMATSGRAIGTKPRNMVLREEIEVRM